RYIAGVKRRPNDNRVCETHTDRHVWFPRARVRSATVARLAENVGAKGRSARAVTLLAEALKLDPTNVRAEPALMRWLDRSAVPWPDARRFIDALGTKRGRCGTFRPRQDNEAAFGWNLADSFGSRPGFDNDDFNMWHASVLEIPTCP